MRVWNLFSKPSLNSEPVKTQEVKKVINHKNLTIKLYDVDWRNTDVVCNIEAFDTSGNLAWTIDKPIHGMHYWHMKIDEKTGDLDADCGTDEHYFISLSDGHIIRSSMMK